MGKKLVKSEEEWRRQLTPEEYRIAREKGTERAFTGEYHDCEDRPQPARNASASTPLR